ncbi:zinc ribbon domain-containing protein [uncultured Meiothermus sp.]|jgi:predicted nucleic-acid-binding Zn-ribbon protein|uniref:zinc ribbon domain-containing protein n=1 Tax=uncultured Meiothermus sp. TaxID=157471 RepID=UPI0026062687|nr:zinc ribbon domain-containing protein [uncultured Meiothermus sp.]
MKLDDLIAKRFLCGKCQSGGALVKRFAATGTGLSRMFDIEHNVFIAASCENCGYTEVYNPEVLEGKDDLGAVMDLLFGG